MKKDKTDRRVKYTKNVLRQSLLDLMKERPINKIFVSNICELADVNRGTFYMHYTGPYDLLSQIQNELYETIRKSVENSLAPSNISTLLLEILEAIAANGDLCKILFSKYGDKEFLKRIMNIAREISLTEWKKTLKRKDDSKLELVYSYIVNGSVGILQEWIQGGMKESPNQIAWFINRISNYGLQGILKSINSFVKQ